MLKSLFEGGEVKVCLSNARPSLYFRDADLLQTVSKIDRVLTESSSMDLLRLETLVMLAVLELSQFVGVPGTGNQLSMGTRLTARQINLVRDYIQGNLHRTITLNELANLVGLSRYHFARSFKNAVGTAPHQYVVALRVEVAQGMLRNKRLRIGDVARLSGFANPSEFSRTFLAHTNERPSDYRRRVRGP